MTRAKLEAQVAREIAGYIGPAFDDLPATYAEWSAIAKETGDFTGESQEGMNDLAKIVVQMCVGHLARIEAGKWVK